jgi:hypothetical protein
MPLLTLGNEASFFLSCAIIISFRSSILSPSQGRTTLLKKRKYLLHCYSTYWLLHPNNPSMNHIKKWLLHPNNPSMNHIKKCKSIIVYVEYNIFIKSKNCKSLSNLTFYFDDKITSFLNVTSNTNGKANNII